MVSRKGATMKRPTGTAVILAALLCAVLALSVLALAQQDAEPTIEEKYEATLNDVGDAHIVDTVEYVSPDDYAVIESLVGENPQYLSRVYTDNTRIGEADNFKAELDESSNSVILTFDTPGYAYNMKEYWMVPGFPSEAKRSSGNKYEVEERYVWNNEFTAFTDQVVDTTTVIVFPGEATDISYDSQDKVMKYSMPPAGTELGFWSENRSLLLIIFGACTLLFLLLFIVVVTRRTASKPAAATPAPGGITAAPTPPAAGVAPASPPVSAGPAKAAPSQPAQASPREYARTATPETAERQCGNCGAKIPPGKKFCTKCGAKG